MTILSAQSIRRFRFIDPFFPQTVDPKSGMSFGLGPASYDVRIAERLNLMKGEFKLASTMERFQMPAWLSGSVRDKSSWARLGLAVQNTHIDPGWEGFLTLELTNHGDDYLNIHLGTPIAQIVFEMLDLPTDQPYKGKYNNQPAGAQPAKFEKKQEIGQEQW